MEYNTARTKLHMPEYGRSVQCMVQILMTIEDRPKRQRIAETIIELMGNLNPHMKTMEDYRAKLWDHLFQMTDFSLDVDCPYPKPTREQFDKKPEPLAYPQVRLLHRHLGSNLVQLMTKGLQEENAEKLHGFTQSVGYYMKLAYMNWHREPVHDDMIKTELSELTKGKMQYETGGYRIHFDPRAAQQQQGGNGYKRGGQGGGNRNFKQNAGQARGGNPNQVNQVNSAQPQRGNFNSAGNSGAGYNNGYNKNRKFNNNNKNKGKAS